MGTIFNIFTGQTIDTDTGRVVSQSTGIQNIGAPPAPSPSPTSFAPGGPPFEEPSPPVPGTEPLPPIVLPGPDAATLEQIGVLAALLGVLQNVLHDVVIALAGLRDLLSKIWKKILAPLFQRFSDWFNRLHRIYNRIIRPMLQQLERYRQLIRRIYNLYFAPILQTIAAIRTFLSITRLNRTAFGRALDDRLARLESKVYAPIAAALGAINDQARLLNILLGPDLFFQQVTHVGSVFRDMGHIANLFYNLSSFPVPPARDALLLTIRRLPTPAEDRQAFADLLDTKAGAFAADYSRDNTDFTLQLKTG